MIKPPNTVDADRIEKAKVIHKKNYNYKTIRKDFMKALKSTKTRLI